MPPKKRDRRRLGARPYKNYTKEMMLLAIDMVQNKNMSSYDAEKNFGIPRRTIERKIKNLHLNEPGPPQRLSEEEQLKFVKLLIVASDYGAPLTLMDLRILVNEYLLKNNKAYIFDGKLPGEWWARNFIERHRDKLTIRAVQNIKRARAEKTVTEFENYFKNLENVVKNVPPTHLVNYDETNFSDNPGTVKCIFRRGIKYPERIMNSTKGCVSVMFAASANGNVLPPYVIYKSEGLWTQWVEGGPHEARYNRTKSGWFDSSTFLDWFATIIIPWARKLEGTKVIIGDNLSSHINIEVIELCEKYNVKFVLLPPNSTQLTQPLDVAFFGPLKKTWRKILTQYKIDNPRQASLNKSHFPPLLKKVMDDVNIGKKENVVSGFKATGIYPFNPQKVLIKVPEYSSNEPEYSVDKVFLDYLKDSRKPNETKRGRNKKLNVDSGMSVTKSDLTKREVIEKQTKKRVEHSVTKKIKNEKADQITITTKQSELETNIKIDDCTGLQSNIAVKVCGALSEDEDPGTGNKENNEPTSGKQYKKRNLNKKALNKKKNKKSTKVSENVESESTTTEDIELSIHSDSDILDIYSEDEEDYYTIHRDNKSPEVIDLDDTDGRKVDKIEEEIFKEIYQRDIESKECDMNDIEILKENSIYDEEPVIKEDQNTRYGEDIYKHTHNNKINLNESKWAVGETILTRYYSSRKWKYYIGVIEKVNDSEKVYSISYYKTRRLGDNIKFVKPIRADKDSSLPENCIVKCMKLLQISENPDEYALFDDDDIIYFK